MEQSKRKAARILLFTFSPYDWPGYYNILIHIFGNEPVEIIKDSIQTFQNDYGDLDLVLTSAKECGLFIMSKLPPEIPILWINHTLDNANYQRVQQMCVRGPVSIAADTLYYADQRLRMLIALGLPAQCFRLWAPELGEDALESQILRYENTKIENTTNKDIISIHGRGLIAADTLVEMLIALDRLDIVQSSAFEAYRKSVHPYITRITDMTDIGRYYAYQRKFGIPTGCLLYKAGYVIYYCDEDAEYILDRPAKEVVGKTVQDLFPSLKHKEFNAEQGTEFITAYRNKRLVLNSWIRMTHGEEQGYILFSDYFEELNKEQKLRKNILSKQYAAKYTFQSIQGTSEAIVKCKEVAKRMAASSASVLIQGPSGSGKELFAQAIHNHSPRKEMPFISVNCGAMVESLLESELFGYVPGAFTGASREGKAGVFELAHKGTLFLDEIGELPLYLQVKLLRVLQEKEVVRVGGREVISIDVRIVAATNRDLKQLVQEGKFRLDLYYRLNVLPLQLPGLDSRREDILPLFESMLQQKGYRFHLHEDARKRILEHKYEGNVRELQNCVEYLGSLGRGDILLEDLPPYMQQEEDPVVRTSVLPASDTPKGRVLMAIRELSSMGQNVGRRSIYRYLQNRNMPLSEMQIRKILHELESEGVLLIRTGRGGIELLDDSR